MFLPTPIHLWFKLAAIAPEFGSGTIPPSDSAPFPIHAFIQQPIASPRLLADGDTSRTPRNHSHTSHISSSFLRGAFSARVRIPPHRRIRSRVAALRARQLPLSSDVSDMAPALWKSAPRESLITRPRTSKRLPRSRREPFVKALLAHHTFTLAHMIFPLIPGDVLLPREHDVARGALQLPLRGYICSGSVHDVFNVCLVLSLLGAFPTKALLRPLL